MRNHRIRRRERGQAAAAGGPPPPRIPRLRLRRHRPARGATGSTTSAPSATSRTSSRRPTPTARRRGTGSDTRAGRPTAASPSRTRTRSPAATPPSSRSSSTGSSRTTASCAPSSSAEGHTFTSETDAEVVVHLLEREYDGDLAQALVRVYPQLEGHFSIVAIHHDHPDLLVGVRSQTPLVVGLGEGENFLASSISAFLSETRSVVFPDDGEVVEITPGRRPLPPRRGRGRRTPR